MAILIDEITQVLRNAIERRDPESIARFATLISARFAPREEAMSVSDGATKGDLAVVSDRLSELIGVVREGFAQMERRFEDMNRRFDDVNKRFEDVNARFEDTNKRFDDVNRRFQATNDRFDDVNKRFDDVNRRFDDVNKRFTQLMWWTGILFGSLHVVLAIYGLGG
jgi:methyl-accepting chemotaxis protein